MRLPASIRSLRPRRRRRRPPSRRLERGEVDLTGSGRLLGGIGADDLVGGDLLEGDAERLARHRADLRRDHVAEPFTELVEVGVDVPGPAGGQRDQRELRVGLVEEILDRRVHHRVVRVFHQSLHRSAARPTSAGSEPWKSTGSGLIDDLQHLLDRGVEVVVDDDWSARAMPTGSSSSALRRRETTVSSSSPRPAQAPFLLGAGGRQDEDQQGVGMDRPSPAGRRRPRSRGPRRRPRPARAAGCRSSCRGTPSTRGSHPRRCAARTRPSS